MEWRGLNLVLASAVAGCLLVGCAAQQGGGQRGSMTAEERLRLAAAAEASGDRDMAVSMYASAASEAPGDTPTQFRCAEGLARNGKIDDAAALLARRLKNAPRDPE